MQLSIEQTQELLRIIDKNQLTIIGSELGEEFLTEYDKQLLRQFGIDPSALFSPEFSSIHTSFHFGMLAEALGAIDASKITYKDLREYIKQGNYIPVSQRQQLVLQSIKMQAFSSLKTMGNNIFSDVNNIVTEKTRIAQQEFLAQELKEGMSKHQTVSQIAHEIARKTGDWGRNFDRIIETASQNAMEQGKAAEIQRRNPDKDPLVYKHVQNCACSSCIKAYLTNGLGSKPIIFKLSELLANGSNIGRKRDEWKPTVDALHPHCFDKDTEVLTKEGWKYFEEVTLNDKFLSVDPVSGNIEWVNAVKKIKFKYTGLMDYFNGYSFNLLTTPNHKHFVSSRLRTGRKYDLIHGFDLKKSYSFVRSYGSWNVTPIKENITIGEYTFDLKDYCAFMGWWLSEGCIVNHNWERKGIRKKSDRWQLVISQEKIKNIDEIDALCNRMFPRVWKGKGKFYIPVKCNVLISFFKGFGKSYEKFIPENIKDLPVEYLNIFLLAYRKGDGSIRHRNNGKINSKEEIVYHSTSKRMIDDLSEMIIKTGYNVSFRNATPIEIEHKNGVYASELIMHTIQVCRSKGTTLLKVDWHKLYYDDYVYDVELEKYHTLYIRRAGKVTISGNCRCSLMEYKEGYLWNTETQSFSIPDPEYVQKTAAKRPLIPVTIGGKTYHL